MTNLRIIAGRAADMAAQGPSERELWEDARGGVVMLGRLWLTLLALAALGVVAWLAR